MKSFSVLCLLILNFSAFSMVKEGKFMKALPMKTNLGISINSYHKIMGTPKSLIEARNVLSTYFSKGWIKDFLTLESGIEGGGEFCIEFFDEWIQKETLKKFSKISYDRSQEVFDYKTVKNCQ